MKQLTRTLSIMMIVVLIAGATMGFITPDVSQPAEIQPAPSEINSRSRDGSRLNNNDDNNENGDNNDFGDDDDDGEFEGGGGLLGLGAAFLATLFVIGGVNTIGKNRRKN